MDKTITTALLIVISMVMAVMLFNVAYPATIEAGDAIASMANRSNERMRNQISIIHGAGELDQDGFWQDSDGSGDFSVMLWVKNIGSTRTNGIERMDVFFGPEGNFARIPHESAAGGVYPYWTDAVENAAEWTPTATLNITVHYQIPLSAGRYFAKVVAPSGVSTEYFLGL